MSFSDLTQAAQQHFPKLQIKYKDQSLLMKLLSLLLFFDKGFLTEYTTVVGNTIYLPSCHFVRVRPISAAVLFLHELTHLYNGKKKAYLSSLYVIWKLSQRLNFNPHLETEIEEFTKQLNRPWMSRTALNERFQSVATKIKRGERPYQDPIFNIIDNLITKM